MSDETPTNVTHMETPTEPVAAASNRSDLIQQARTFLQSPQIHSEDYAAKRRFLSKKGLNDVEIDSLLQETVIIHRFRISLHSNSQRCLVDLPTSLGAPEDVSTASSI